MHPCRDNTLLPTLSLLSVGFPTVRSFMGCLYVCGPTSCNPSSSTNHHGIAPLYHINASHYAQWLCERQHEYALQTITLRWSRIYSTDYVTDSHGVSLGWPVLRHSRASGGKTVLAGASDTRQENGIDSSLRYLGCAVPLHAEGTVQLCCEPQ